MSEARVVFITGASSGIGEATARMALDQGWSLALVARGEDRLAALADALAAPERVMTVTADVREWTQVEHAVAAALDRFGRIDVVLANAGFGVRSGFTNSDPEAWRDMILTNVYGAAITVRATIAAIIAAKGHVVLTGSVAGRKALPGSIYSATKWAVSAMGESLRQELNGTGARVTVVEPGFVDTPFFDDGSPLPGSLEAQDVAEAVIFALTRPPRVDVNEILVRPTTQDV